MKSATLQRQFSQLLHQSVKSPPQRNNTIIAPLKLSPQLERGPSDGRLTCSKREIIRYTLLIATDDRMRSETSGM